VPDAGGVAAGYYGVFLTYENVKGVFWNAYLQGGAFWHQPISRPGAGHPEQYITYIDVGSGKDARAYLIRN
jgi:hypothetical protein